MMDSPWLRTGTRIAVMPFPGIENAFLCVSGLYRDKTRELTRSVLTFTYIDDEQGIAAEWNGEGGPIQLYFRDPPSDTDELIEGPWLWETQYGSGYWAQAAVSERGLYQAFVDGRYAQIFHALKDFCDR